MGEGIEALLATMQEMARILEDHERRLKVVERPFCDHRWEHWCNDVTGQTTRVCKKCGLKEYMP